MGRVLPDLSLDAHTIFPNMGASPAMARTRRARTRLLRRQLGEERTRLNSRCHRARVKQVLSRRATGANVHQHGINHTHPRK